MADHSPLDYSRELRQRPPDRPADSSASLDKQPAQDSPFNTIRRAITPSRIVFNPRGRAENAHSVKAHGQSPELTGRERQRSQTPRRRKRGHELSRPIGLQIRPEESRLLTEVGKFRIIAVADLEKEIYQGNHSQLRHDLEFLKENGLIERHFLNLRRDGKSDDVRRFEAVTLTKIGRKLLIATGQIAEGQRIYSGLVKPREAEHDAQVFRACLREAAEVERAGGRNLRVRLDFELKARLNRAVYLARKAEPERDAEEIKAKVAQQFGLKLRNHKVVVPDARLEYDLPSGGPAHIDVEVATSAYRHGHLAAKVKAGFKLYISDGDAGRLGAAVQDDHDLMSEILDL